jgi:hypothetical protein
MTALPSLNPHVKFTDIRCANGDVSLTWQGGKIARQVLEQAADLAGPWSPIFTNQTPTPITNSISIPASDGISQYFRIRVGQ